MSLKFLWAAQFNDATQIYQVDGEGKEHKFQEVLDRQDDLVSFALIHQEKSLIISVNLNSGLITRTISKSMTPEAELLESSKKVRLIFFRRVHRKFNISTLKEVSVDIKYFLGYQYKSDEGKNRKMFLQIDGDGNTIIGS